MARGSVWGAFLARQRRLLVEFRPRLVAYLLIQTRGVAGVDPGFRYDLFGCRVVLALD
jgi:hypothetical protein